MSLNLTLEPSQTEIILLPGSSFVQSYKITNNSDSTSILSTSISNWSPSESDSQVIYNEKIPSFFKFTLNNADLLLDQPFTLKPHETKQLVLKIASSPSAPFQDQYFTFFINQENSTTSIEDEMSRVATIGRLGSHILISTSPTTETTSNFSISSFNSNYRFVDIFFPAIKLLGTVKNNSDYFNPISGKVIISHHSQKTKEMDIFPHNILAQSQRDIKCLVDNQPTSCYLSPPLWPGKYSATLQLETGQWATATFYVFPFSIIILIIALVGIFLLAVKKKSKY